MTDLYTGGCQCGAMRYEFRAPLHDIAHCHCSICRRCSGAIVTTWLTVPLASFNWLKGQAKTYASSASCTRNFCPDCGAQLTLLTTLSPDTLDITVATLDEPQHAHPDRHIWVQSRLPWLILDPALPQEQQEQIP